MKLLPIEEVNVVAFTPKLSRVERLVRWANLVRCSKSQLHLYHNLEHMSKRDLRSIQLDGAPSSAFTVAIKDDAFKAEGIGSTMGEVMDFFELSQAQLHEFSCDCGGSISKADMADRIEGMTGRAPAINSSSWTGRWR